MSMLFNSEFETGLRILLILTASEKELSVGQIVDIDFITLYGKDFGISEINLHGTNNFRFSEYSSRRELIGKALKRLVLSNYVNVKYLKSGFFYFISNVGRKYCSKLNNDYGSIYSEIVKSSLKYIEEKRESSLLGEITNLSIYAITGGNTHE